MALDQTFREHEGDDYFKWMQLSAHEMEEFAEFADARAEADPTRQPVTVLSGFSLSAWLSR
jgi:hypothetical protein